MADIKLTATSRANLLSLNQTTDLANRTQSRLSTGLKVGSAIDDATAYFASKSLSDRSSDFATRKGEIDQGISSLKTALSATESADKILKQLKGVAISAKTADTATKADLTKQFSDLLGQLNSLLGDASYQGTNLINNDGDQKLTVRFSEVTTAELTVDARDLRAGALITAGGGASATGSEILSALLAAANSAGAQAAGFSAIAASRLITTIDSITAAVDTAVSAVRATASNLGSNITLLQTRSDFSKNYINALTEGSDKLTLADLNEEGANLVALQTRQQLALKALSFAGQSEQSVLSLFN
ncbi:flagellin [Zavarzinia compransoris]|uniref:Flagellin n=1 Tax=Zavarzinia compransoris TaxID=1264899 RepID=A0A317DYG2_9PROT|nr:flagellin [Zavarzinia compransoris]PWR19787.1 flagellin [Zavarzinia compransoris]TDP45109.1 flagellin-like hook-associated protein FlgL [Zavarzinia compransoris]